MKETRSGRWSPQLTDEDKITLFSIGTDTLEWCVHSGKKKFSFDGYDISDCLKEPMATFVTLKVGERLRGCIGSLVATDPLYESVHDNAVNAALRDPRFPRVDADELAGISMHISILSQIRAIASVDEFKLGEHGIIMRKGLNRAVFLPEVAPEQGWNREQTLSSLSMKAGLHPDAWQNDAQFEVFSSVALCK